MAGAVIQDISVNIGATTVEYETAIKRVLVGNQEIQNKLGETAAKSKKFADEQARASKRIEDAEQAKVAAIRAGEAAVATAQDKATAASQRAVQVARDEAATRSKLAAVIAADEGKASVAAINRVAKARAGIDASLAREQSAAAKSIQLDQEVADAKVRLAQLPLEHDQRIARTREAEAERLANTLIAIENRLAGLYLRNQATLSAAAAKEESERVAAARAAQREAELKEKAANEIAAAAEREAARVAAAKAKEAAAAEAAAAEEAAAARRAAEAQIAAAKQAARSRQFMVQNMAFQVGDVFTQAQFSGYGRAIATQLPQMLGGFGMIGAVVGAAAAALAPMAMKLFEADEAAGNADETFSALSDTISGLKEANERALEGTDELVRKYGDMSEKMRTSIRSVIDNKLELAKVETKEMVGSLASEMGSPDAYFEQVQRYAEAKRKVDEMRSGVLAAGDDPMMLLNQFEAEEVKLASLQERLDEVAKAYGLTREQAEQFLRAAAQSKQVKEGTDEYVAALENMRAALAAGTGDATKEALEFRIKLDESIQSLIELSRQSRVAAGETSAIGDAGDRAAAGISNATSRANELRAALSAASRALDGIGARAADQEALARIDNETVGDPVARARRRAGYQAGRDIDEVSDIRPNPHGTTDDAVIAQAKIREEAVRRASESAERIARIEADTEKRTAAIRDAASKGGGGGRKGGGASKEEREQAKKDERELNELMRESGQITESVRTEEEKRAAALEHIAELQRGGMLGMSEAEMERIAGLPQAERAAEIAKNAERNAEVAAQAIQAVNEQYSGLSDAQSTVKDGARDVFRSIIAGAGGAQDALANLAGRLSDLFADKAFDGIWGALTGSIGGGAGGGFGKLLSFIPGFAGGTESAPGGLALVGERGPELVNLARGSQVITADRTRQIMAGGTSKSQAEVIIRAAEGVTVEQVRQIAGDVSVRITSQAAAAQSRALGSQLQETQRRGTK